MPARAFANTAGRDLSGRKVIEYDGKSVAGTISRRAKVAPWTSTEDGSTHSGGSIHIVFDKPVTTAAGIIIGWILADEDLVPASTASLP